MDVRTWRSTNGRWGVQCVYPVEVAEALRAGIVRAMLNPLGHAAGLDCFEIIPTALDNFVVIGQDLIPHAGCIRVVHSDLQSNDYLTILVARAGAIWEDFGYRRRSSEFRVLTSSGEAIEAPPAVLLVAGMIEPHELPADVPVPPQLAEAVAASMCRAGIIRGELTFPMADVLRRAGVVS